MARQLARQQVRRICAVCERTLLTGERALRFAPNGDEFVDVCPLCAAIALEHGWIKEGSPTTPTVPSQRRRKRRGLASLFDPRRQPAGGGPPAAPPLPPPPPPAPPAPGSPGSRSCAVFRPASSRWSRRPTS